MSFKSRIDVGCKLVVAAITMAGVLSGCSDIYYDRRETVALGADDAIASNRVAQMIDPWPRYVQNKNIAFNGERAQAAVERYRRDCAFRADQPDHHVHDAAADRAADGMPGAKPRTRCRRSTRARPRRRSSNAGADTFDNSRELSGCMRIGRPNSAAGKTQVVVLTADAGFEEQARQTFGASDQIALRVVSGTLSASMRSSMSLERPSPCFDLDAGRQEEMQALDRLMARIGSWPPVVVITQSFRRGRRAHASANACRRFPDQAGVAGRAGADLRARRQRIGRPRTTEAEIYTFLPAVGGAGVTTLAVQSAMMLLNSGQRGKASTCLVDLDFQHGACADYLDLEPRLDLGEIEPRPERLDRQLLEVMLSHHPSGLAVVAAPNRPAEMRSFDPDMVTRLLDLVSSHFDHVVFDMPRTWFSWTDSVLLGSNKLFIVSEMTVPGLRHAKQLVEAVRERLADGPQPRVIINRFEQRLFSSGLRKADIEQVLGDAFAACIPNDYGLVREAIDRGIPLEEVKPGNKITTQLRKLVLPRRLPSRHRRRRPRAERSSSSSPYVRG